MEGNHGKVQRASVRETGPGGLLEKQLEFPFGLRGMLRTGVHRKEILLLESNLLSKIRKKGRCQYPSRLPDEQMVLRI